jgi:hypothetical protein
LELPPFFIKKGDNSKIKKGDNSNIKKGDNSNIKKGDNSNIKREELPPFYILCDCIAIY